MHQALPGYAAFQYATTTELRLLPSLTNPKLAIVIVGSTDEAAGGPSAHGAGKKRRKHKKGAKSGDGAGSASKHSLLATIPPSRVITSLARNWGTWFLGLARLAAPRSAGSGNRYSGASRAAASDGVHDCGGQAKMNATHAR